MSNPPFPFKLTPLKLIYSLTNTSTVAMSLQTYTNIHIEPTGKGKVYLSVDGLDFTGFLVPFFSLAETGAQPHEDGWLIPSEKMTVLHPFLEMVSEASREMKISARDMTKAQVFWVSRSELPLLVSLYALPKLTQELSDLDGSGYDQEDILGMLEDIVSEMLPTIEDYLTASAGDIQPFLDLEARYIRAKYEDVIRGDLCKHEFQQYRNSATFIYDGQTFTPLYFDADEYGSLPPEYQCPSPFPVTYWTGLIEHNILVWPNFAQFGKEMKLESEPPAPHSKAFDWLPSGFKDHPHKAALRWEFAGRVYRIYFYSQTPLTEVFMKADLWKKARYYAVVETEIIADVE